MDSPKCGSCGATLNAPGGWRPVLEGAVGEAPAGVFYAISVTFGFTFLLASVFPVGNYAAQIFSGGMYGTTFRKMSPAFYLLFSMSLNYLVPAAIIGMVLRKLAILSRVPAKYRSARLFGLGSLLLFLYLGARVLAATVPGGGGGFAVASLSPFIVWPAMLMLFVAAARFFVGIGRGAANPAFQRTAPGGL